MSDTLAPDTEFPKKCGCGKQHDRISWNKLPLAGRTGGLYFDTVETIEMRNCPCGSTIAVSLGEGDFTKPQEKKS